MRGLRDVQIGVLCILTPRLALGDLQLREYALGAWSTTFYRPQEAHINAIGIMNQDLAFLATKSAVLAMNRGLVSAVVKVAEEEIRSFHLCHHRNSIFYEVLASDGIELTLFEQSLQARERAHPFTVATFQDAAPATALACADHLLLRASNSGLDAIDLIDGKTHALWQSNDPEGPGMVTSLTVAHAADVLANVDVFGVVPSNRSILRFHIGMSDGRLVAHAEPLLLAGHGEDGPLSTASVHEPLHVVWSSGKVLFADGCSVRQLQDGKVMTLVGSPNTCVEIDDESLGPLPWVSLISRPVALAREADGTAGDITLVLSGKQVFRIEQRANTCSNRLDQTSCLAEPGCAWAEGSGVEQRACFPCADLDDWMHKQNPLAQLCTLQDEQGSTRYNLGNCGCSMPTSTAPTEHPTSESADGAGSTLLQVFLSMLTAVAALVAGVFLYRAVRRAAVMRDLYASDTAEFHTFADDETFH